MVGKWRQQILCINRTCAMHGTQIFDFEIYFIFVGMKSNFLHHFAPLCIVCECVLLLVVLVVSTTLEPGRSMWEGVRDSQSIAPTALDFVQPAVPSTA